MKGLFPRPQLVLRQNAIRHAFGNLSYMCIHDQRPLGLTRSKRMIMSALGVLARHRVDAAACVSTNRRFIAAATPRMPVPTSRKLEGPGVSATGAGVPVIQPCFQKRNQQAEAATGVSLSRSDKQDPRVDAGRILDRYEIPISRLPVRSTSGKSCI
jgi:hypothetical protein